MKIDEIRKRCDRDVALASSMPILNNLLSELKDDRAYLLSLIDKIEAKCERYWTEVVTNDDGTRIRCGSLATAGKLSNEIREIINADD